MEQPLPKINLDDIYPSGVFFVDKDYSRKHTHLLHKHQGILELLYVAQGEGRYSVGNREYAVHAGDLVICNADTIHGEAPFQEHSIQTYCLALSGVNLKNLPKGYLIDKAKKPVLTLNEYDNLVAEIMVNLYLLYNQKKDNNLLLCRHLAVSLFLLVYKLVTEHNEQSKSVIEQKNEDMVRKLTNYLDENYTENITLEKISKIMHISISHISHLFKRETGLSPMQYVIHRRIGQAQSLLAETNIPIKQIEEQLGFGSSCHLTSMFKKYVGISPREYRKYFADKNK